MNLSAASWSTYSSFNINPDNAYFIYAKITDNAGNIIYINTDGIVVDSTKPVVSSTDNGKWFISDSQYVSVSLTDNLAGFDFTSSDVTYIINSGTAVNVTSSMMSEDVLSIPVSELSAGLNTITVNAKDKSSNAATAYTFSVYKDSTAVSVNISTDTESYDVSKTISITPTAGVSGITKVEIKLNDGEYVDITDSYESGYIATANGTYTVRVTNGAGETVESSPIVISTIDSVTPVLSVDTDGYTSGTWSDSNVTVTGNNSASNIGDVTYKYSTNGTDWTTMTDDSKTFGDGTNGTYYFKAVSASGLESEIITKTIKVDTSNPTGTINVDINAFTEFLSDITFNKFFKNSVDVTIDADDATSGIKTVEYIKTDSAKTLSELGLATWTSGDSFRISPDEKCIVYARITDNAGNSIIVSTNGFIVDGTAPVITSSDNNKWFTDNSQAVTVKVTDNLAGFDLSGSDITYKINSGSAVNVSNLTDDEFTVSVADLNEGSNTITVNAKDKASNSATEFVLTAKKDTSEGSVTISTDTSSYDNSKTITISATGITSGVKKAEIQKDDGTWVDITDDYNNNGKYVIDENGSYKVRVETNAGKVITSDSVAVTTIDTVTPVLTIDTGTYTSGTWSTSDVVIDVGNSSSNIGTTVYQYSTDNGNTWKNIENQSLTLSDGTNGTYQFRAVSAAGLVSTVVTKTIKVDTTAPTAKITVAADSWLEFISDITFNIFYNRTVGVNITSSDATSGIKTVEYIKTSTKKTLAELNASTDWTAKDSFNISPDEKCIVYARVTDNAGNSVIISTNGFIVDGTAPTVSSEADNTWVNSNSDTISISVADNLAGLDLSGSDVTYKINSGDTKNVNSLTSDAFTISASELSEGENTITVNAKDRASNAATEFTITVSKEATRGTVSITTDLTTFDSSKTIEITATGITSGVKKVEIQKDNGEWDDITDDYNNNGSYDIDENGKYTVRVTTDAGTILTSEPITVTTVDTTVPVLSIDTGTYVSDTWSVSDVTVDFGNTASNLGTVTYKYSTDNGTTWETVTGTSLTLTDGTNATYIFKAVSAAGLESETVTKTIKIDKTKPTGKITIETLWWKDFINTITFDHFFKDSVSVSISTDTDTSGIANVSYYVSASQMTLTAVKAIPSASWTTGTSFSRDPDDSFVVYVKLTDNAGNVNYISSDGIAFDVDDPVVTGAENGKTYYAKHNITVTDDTLNEVKVSKNGGTAASYTISNGTASVNNLANDNSTYVVTAKDKAGNEISISFTLKSVATFIDELDNDWADANNPTKNELDKAIDDIDDLLISENSNLTTAEKQALNEKKDELLGKYLDIVIETGGIVTIDNEMSSLTLDTNIVKTVLEKLFDNDDSEVFRSGGTVSVKLTISEINSDTPNETKASNDGNAVIKHIKITVVKTTTDAQSNVSNEDITVLDSPLNFNIDVSNYAKTDRLFYVYQDHLGVSSKTADLDSSGDSVGFSSKTFSVFTIAYTPDTDIAGTVKDSDGLPVEGAKVELVDKNGSTIANTTTDENGDYIFENIPDGDYDIKITAPDNKTKGTGSATVTENGEVTQSTADVTLTDYHTKSDISGKVTDKNGNPVSGATVSLKDEDGKTVATVTTDKNGDYIFKDIKDGKYTIEVTLPGSNKTMCRVISKFNKVITGSTDISFADYVEPSDTNAKTSDNAVIIIPIVSAAAAAFAIVIIIKRRKKKA